LPKMLEIEFSKKEIINDEDNNEESIKEEKIS